METEQAQCPIGEHRACKMKRADYSVVLPALLALAHRALANADNRALPAAEKFRFLAGWTDCAPARAAILLATPARILARPSALSLRMRPVPLSLAHLALAAAPTAARPAALIPRFLGPDSTSPPRS